jgi:syntaxin-binding protein 5
MTVEGDNYSSILLHAGTNLGRVGTFKIVPDPSGRYTVQFAGTTSLDGRVIHLAPIDAQSGMHAYASQNVVANLRTGYKVDGAVLAVTHSEVRVFRPATGKGAHKTFDNYFCDAGAVSRYREKGHCFVGLFGDGTVRAYSLPALREIASVKVDHILDVRRFADSIVTTSGDILGWKGPSEMALITVWGTGEPLPASQDKLVNIEALLPPRPTISNMQWVSGTQYITPADMDVLSNEVLCVASVINVY